MEIQLPNGLVLIMYTKGGYDPNISMDTIVSRCVYVDHLLQDPTTYDPRIEQLWNHRQSKQCEWIKIKKVHMSVMASLFTSTTPFHVLTESNAGVPDLLAFYAKGRIWEYRPTYQLMSHRLISHPLMTREHAVQFANDTPLIVSMSQWYVIVHQKRNVFYYHEISRRAGCAMVFPSSVVIELYHVAGNETCTLLLRHGDPSKLFVCKINLFQRANDRWYRFDGDDISNLFMSHYGLRDIITGDYIDMMPIPQPLPVIVIF